MEKRITILIPLLAIYSLVSSIFLIKLDNKVNEQTRITKNVAESILSLEDAMGIGRGTGFLTLTPNGKKVIITNAHVCEMNPGKPIFVVYHRKGDVLREKLKSLALVLKKDDEHDLCVVSVPAELETQPLVLADDIEVDTKVYIIGYPVVQLLSSSDGFIRGYEGVDQMYPLTPERCIASKYYTRVVPITYEDGKITLEKRCFLKATFIFTDALGDHGQSGSPALNGDGEVVGVMSSIKGDARPFALLVPLTSLKKFLSSF